MKVVHFLVGVVLFLLVVLGLYAGYCTVAVYGAWEQILALLKEEHHIMLAWSAIAGLLLILLYRFSASRRSRDLEFISFDGKDGPVSISVRAVRDFIEKLADNFVAIKSMQPKLITRHGRVQVDLDLRVQAGTRVPELCQALQENVRESLSEGLGLADVKKIRVTVKEIMPAEPEEEEPAEAIAE